MSRKKDFYFQNRYFISGVRYATLLENPENTGKTMINIIRENSIDTNITWRFKKFDKCDDKKGNLEIDLSQVNVSNSGNEASWVEVDPNVVKIIKQMILEGLSDEEIKSQIYTRLRSGGINMSSEKVIKNISVDMGNNYAKVAIDDKVFSFVNKVRKERQVNKLADNDYITLNDDLGYYVIGCEDDTFEESLSKKDKNFIPTLYYSLCRALNEAEIESEEVDINLSMLTPVNQANEIRDYIAKVKERDSCMCSYRINKNEGEFILNIKNVDMLLEGAASLPLIENHNGMQAVVDIGSKTVNIIKARNSRIVTVDTLDDLGSFEYYEKLINKINDRTVNVSNINQLIEDGIQNHDKELLKEYLRKILEEANKIVKFSTCVNVNFTGGTVKLFKDNGLNFEKENIKIMNEPTFTNVRGSKVFLDAKYKVAAGE